MEFQGKGQKFIAGILLGDIHGDGDSGRIFCPHVEGLPLTDANARSPTPTLTSAFVERGMMAEVGPTVKSSATMFV